MVSLYLRQHAAYDAPAINGEHFRPFYRRRTRLDDLRDEQAISPRVYLAAILYRDLVEHVSGSARSALRTVFVDGSSSGIDGGRALANAATQLRDIRAQLGTFAAVLVELVVVLDLPWRELGRRYRVDPKTIKRYAIDTLQLLAQVMQR